MDNHARPIPIKGRPSKTKKKKKKKKRVRGGLPSANVYARTHAHTHTKKNLRSDISDSLTVNWGVEKASPSFLFRLPPNQNLKNAENPKERQVCPCNAYTTRAPSACAFKTAIPTKWRSWCVGDSRHMVDWSMHPMEAFGGRLYDVLRQIRPHIAERFKDRLLSSEGRSARNHLHAPSDKE